MGVVLVLFSELIRNSAGSFGKKEINVKYLQKERAKI